MLEQIVPRSDTKLAYTRRNVHIEDVSTENNGTLEARITKRVDVPIYVVVEVMQIERFPQQLQSKDPFYEPNVKKAQCFMGTQNIQM